MREIEEKETRKLRSTNGTPKQTKEDGTIVATS